MLLQHLLFTGIPVKHPVSAPVDLFYFHSTHPEISGIVPFTFWFWIKMVNAARETESTEEANR
jgi:hypothetical protein